MGYPSSNFPLTRLSYPPPNFPLWGLNDQSSIFPIIAIAVVPDGPIVTAHRDWRVYRWNTKGEWIGELRVPSRAPVTAVAVVPDGTIVTAHRDGRVYLWTTRGKRRRELRLPRTIPVTAIAIGPDGAIMTAQRDGQVRQWGTGGRQVSELHLPEGTPVKALAMTTDNTIVVARRDGTTFIFLRFTAALWTRITMAFVILGLIFFVERVWRIRSEESVSPGLESDKPADDSTKVTKSMNDMADRIANLLSNPHSHPPLTLCVDGAWGRGKSSLMNLVAKQLRDNNCTCVFFNAWHHQNESHLFAVLMEQIRKSWRPRSYMNWLPASDQKLSIARRIIRHCENFQFNVKLWSRRFGQAPICFLSFSVSLCLLALLFLITFNSSIQMLFQIKFFHIEIQAVKLQEKSSSL